MVSKGDSEIVKEVKTEIENFIVFFTGSDERSKGLMLQVLDTYLLEAYSNKL